LFARVLATAGGHAFWEGAWLVPWATMVGALALVDARERVVPTPAVRLATASVLALLAAACAVRHDWAVLARGAGCATAVWVFLATWALLAPKALGFGDVRMAFLVGLGAGAVSAAGALAGLACAPLGAGLWGKLPMRRSGGRYEEGVALGPFLALAGIAVAVAGAT
jgi:leader peptidase (prepilin peptidase) / N-methyltransferase